MRKRSFVVLAVLLTSVIVLMSCQSANTGVTKSASSSVSSCKSSSDVYSNPSSQSSSNATSKITSEPKTSSSSSVSSKNSSSSKPKVVQKAVTPKASVNPSKPAASSKPKSNSSKPSSKPSANASSSKPSASSKSEDVTMRPCNTPVCDCEGGLYRIDISDEKDANEVTVDKYEPWKVSSISFVPRDDLSKLCVQHIHYYYVMDSQVNAVRVYFNFDKFKMPEPDRVNVDNNLGSFYMIINYSYGKYTCSNKVLLGVINEWNR